MSTMIRSTARSAESTTASRRGANARKRDESTTVRRAEVRREAAGKAARVGRRLGLLLLAAILLAGLFHGGRVLVLRQGWIELREIVVAGNHSVSVAEVVAGAGVFHGESLASLDLALVRSRLAGHPWIEGVSVSRSLPHGLRIVLRERQPVLALPDGRWVGADGRIMDPRGVRVLPVLAGSTDGGIRVDLGAMGTVEAAGRMLREAPRLSLRMREVRLETDGSMTVRLDGFAPSIRVRPEDWKRGLARAGALEKELMTEAERIAEIDLRHGSCAALRRREGGV